MNNYFLTTFDFKLILHIKVINNRHNFVLVGMFLLLLYLSNLLKMEFLNNINWRRGQPIHETIHEIERNSILLSDGVSQINKLQMRSIATLKLLSDG